MKEKIGIGIITCNRPAFLKQCYKSVIPALEKYDCELIIVNDGSYFKEERDEFTKAVIVQNDVNQGVGKSKNIALRFLLSQKRQHIFIIEDDIVVKNVDVFEAYIKASRATGIQHFNFGYHGPANRGNISGGAPTPRFIVDYPDGTKIAINGNSVGAFCYWTRGALEKVGLIDEEFTNAFEHVEHDYRMFKAGYCTPYWNWPDLANSLEYLDEQACSEASSSIRPRPDWRENIIKGVEIFKKKHGFSPAWQNAVPDTPKTKVLEFLRKIYPK